MKRTGISLLILAASTALLTTGQAATLFNNSNITTGIGNGLAGANTSAIATGNGTFGFSANGAAATISLADDFSLPSLSTVTNIIVDAYSTSTYPSPPTTSPFTAATVSIWNAQPGTVGAVALFTSTTLATTAWTGVYRVTPTTLTNAQRPVFNLSVSFSGVVLPAGTYWASYSITGAAAPGTTASIFTPPVMNADGTQPAGNAIQSTDGGTTWIALTDTTSLATNRVPLSVIGTAVVPEPATVTLTVLGGIALVAVARRRRLAA